jgi:hypothetical protein
MQEPVPPQPPTPPAPPAPPAPSGIPVPGGRLIVEGMDGSPAAVYQGLKARGEELSDQHQRLEDQRGELTSRLQQGNLDDVDRAGMRTQLADVDARLTSVNKQIAANDEAIAQAAGVPGAIVKDEAPPSGGGPPEGVIAIPIVFTIFVLFPISFAWARRLWKKPLAGPAPIPPELMDRMARLEQAVESVAVEVERIGEGQRFVTKLFAEGPRPLELPK